MEAFWLRLPLFGLLSRKKSTREVISAEILTFTLMRTRDLWCSDDGMGPYHRAPA